MLAGLLIPLTFLGLALLAYGPGAPEGSLRRTRRGALALAGVFTALWAAAGAEVLSLGHHLACGPVLAWWGGSCAVLAALIWRARARLALGPRPARPDWRTAALLAPTIAVLAFTLFMAVATPPTTWDSISYHLPRQVFWIQQQGVQHYAATDLRQLESPPLAEFIGVQLMLLFQGDGAINLIQWAAFALSIGLSSLIAGALGAPAPGRAFAALMVACLPSAATQAENAKNDLVVAFFLFMLVWLVVAVWKRRRVTLATGAMIGVCGGLLALTKGTGYIYALPAEALVAWACLRASWRRAIPAGVLAAAIALALNAGHFSRNYHYFQNPVALPKSRGGFGLDNRAVSARSFASNVVRTVSLELGTPWEGWNTRVKNAVLAIHDRLGISASDERTTAQPERGFDVIDQTISDGNSPAPVHLLLAFGLIALPALAPRRVLARPAPIVYLLVPGVFGAFCTLLAWQSWNNRVLIPAFALVAPLAAADHGIRRLNLVRTPAAIACAVLVWPSLLYNPAKAVIGPSSIWRVPERARVSVTEAGYGARMREAADLIRASGARSVGLQPGWVTTYPLMRELYWGMRPPARILLTQPNYLPPGDEAPEPGNGQPPDFIVAWPDAVKMDMVVRGFIYRPVLGERGFIVYRRAEPRPMPAGAPLFGPWDSVRGLLPTEPPSNELQFPERRQVRMTPVVAEFTGDGSARDLIVEARGDGRPGQSVAVILNGEELARVTLGNPRDASYARVPLPARKGRNTLELREVPPRTDLHRIAYQRIAIVPPRGGADGAGAPQGAGDSPR